MKNQCTAFNGGRIIASGSIDQVAAKTKEFLDGETAASILIFDDATGSLVEIDFRGTVKDVLAKLPSSSDDTRKAGRPKLGVVSREVTLLPRHWEWLNAQPGGASVALRKLVETASKGNSEQEKIRDRLESVYKFMSAMTGDLPEYEEAIRSLFARNKSGFEKHIKSWPKDLRTYIERIAADVF